MIPTIILVWYYFEFLLPVIEYAGEAGEIMRYITLTLVLSRFFQLLLTDEYIAQIEAIRWTRGWDGLVSLG